jgi:hypothetical protein
MVDLESNLIQFDALSNVYQHPNGVLDIPNEAYAGRPTNPVELIEEASILQCCQGAARKPHWLHNEFTYTACYIIIIHRSISTSPTPECYVGEEELEERKKKRIDQQP